MARTLSKAVNAKLARVKLLLCDVDGVLTDARVYVGTSGEFKAFHIQDGLGLRLLQREGIRVGWVSSRPSTATQQRAEELKIDFLHQGRDGKVDVVEGILGEAGVKWGELCYMGDDVVDLGVMKRAGLSVAVPNGIDEVLARADYVTRAGGGHGAVREVALLILKAQNKWRRIVREYSS